MKVALVYDRVNKWGGAERVLLALHKLFPKASLFTSVHHTKKADWANVFDTKTSFLQQFPIIRSNHEFIPYLMPIAFENFSFDGYDLVISVTSEAAKGIITKPGTVHICYCLTPTRYLWSGYDEYFSHPLMRTLAKPAVSYLQKWDKMAAKRPDHFVAISKEVQERIKKYYGMNASVIYPPVTLPSPKNTSKRSKKNADYFLVVSRLSQFTKYKRIDLAIEACNILQVPLKIVGGGSWEKELRAKAGPTIEFLGNVTDDQLISYYQQSKGLIFPAREDFGLTILEAQSFGKPVIAFRAGGAQETIIEGKTGYFFDKQTVAALVAALKKFDTFTFDPAVSRKQAEKFSEEKFKKQFLSLVKKLI